MLKILQAMLQQHVSQEPPDVHTGFWKGIGTRDQIANKCWIIEKANKFPQKNILYFCITDYVKAFDYVGHNCVIYLMRWKYQIILHAPEKPEYRARSNS